jgi:hypothetical protein
VRKEPIMLDLTIRFALETDLAAARDLLREQLRQHSIDLSDGLLRHAVKGLLDNPERGRTLVVARGQRVIGVAVLSFLWTLEPGGQAAWLDELYIEPGQ